MFYFALDKQKFPWYFSNSLFSFSLGKNNFLWYLRRYIAHFDGNCNCFLSLWISVGFHSTHSIYIAFFLCFQGIFISQFSIIAHVWLLSGYLNCTQSNLFSTFWKKSLFSTNLRVSNEQNRNILKKNLKHRHLCHSFQPGWETRSILTANSKYSVCYDCRCYI